MIDDSLFIGHRSKAMASDLFNLFSLRGPLPSQHRTVGIGIGISSSTSFEIRQPQFLVHFSPSISESRRAHHQKSTNNSKISCLSREKETKQSSSSSFNPPSSREEAIFQAKTCLSSALHKSLNNPISISRQKIKKKRQPRFRVEIPIIQESTESLSQFACDVFLDLPISRKGQRPTILMVWPDILTSQSSSQQLFPETSLNYFINSDLDSLNAATLKSADLLVFTSPETSALGSMRDICDEFQLKPAVIFNPNWRFEEEEDFGNDLKKFLGTFDVVYSFLGLEVKGILSKKNGLVFRFVKDGVFNKEEWSVYVEDEDTKDGQMKVVSRFNKRPAIGDVETVLYNLMAAKSPLTKSVKFISDFASKVTGKKPN
ncbi:hypothetical protein ZOSMA_381G00190 [Zostera marina]|uniref:DUF1995 domain-containing protein n=1 Tax=Zostera marina TaxID=29655 RepID=A0A0K9P7D6_ZOSMR|nr:hypothetical protein ZOSMA_381G00190 [Zostera marina]